ncbi:MAG TPA: ATP-binding cassette domain-containing protein [Tepidisphaeraceae bacterium]|nr:ATP-binding cassette domain-containing protein [Tepidisphaeraceae bacterium]
MEALRCINFVLAVGDWAMIEGPNGSGKSTFLRAIAAQQSLDHGEIHLFGRPNNILRPAEIARTVFYVNQNPLLGTAPDLTVLENLLVADARVESHRASRVTLRDQYAALLTEAHLEDRLKQRVDTLSAGQRQFLTLLIAELRMVPLILLDEPFAALDEANEALCLQKLQRLNASGRSLLHITHDLEHSAVLGARRVRITEGVLTEQARVPNHSPPMASRSV